MFNMKTAHVVFWQPSIPCCLQGYIGLPQQQGGLPQALGWTAIPWQQGSTLDYPCQRGSSGICIPDIAGDNPCDIGPSLPWTLDFNVEATILGSVVHCTLAKYLRVAEY